MSATRTRARRGEGDSLREEILGAAERLLIETGSEATVEGIDDPVAAMRSFLPSPG